MMQQEQEAPTPDECVAISRLIGKPAEALQQTELAYVLSLFRQMPDHSAEFDMEIEGQLKPFTCPYCGCPTPEGDDLVLDAWGYFHCDGEDAGEECGARLRLDDSGRAIGYINRTPEGDTQLS